MSNQDNGRLIDIPYATSPPLLFTYQHTAILSAGKYDFGGVTGGITRTPFSPNRPLTPNVLYIFRTINFSLDIDQNDYQAAIDTLPEFSAYVQAQGGAPAFREALPLPAYLLNVPYTLCILGEGTTNASYPGAVAPAGGLTQSTFNRLLGSVTGILNATAALAGKGSLTAVVTLSAQEVKDNNYVEAFRALGRGSPAAGPAGKQFV